MAKDPSNDPEETPDETTGEPTEAAAEESTESDDSTSTDAGTEEAGSTGADDPLDSAAAAEPLSASDEALLDAAATDLVADYREQAARAQAELVNFRNRVERDRAANREAVVAEVIRSLLPALDDLARAEKHGDLEGSPLEIVATKIHASFERYGLRSVGEKGEPFDPHFHEAVVHLPSAEVDVETVHDVIETGYALGDRLLRAAKVAVSSPES